jgi:hypothetical protein
MRQVTSLLACLSLAALGLGASGCLHLTMVDASVKKPSNVAVYFSVTDMRKRPVPSLTADKFKIYEDGKLVSVFESKQTILNPEVAVVQYTLLLMDMSGSITQSGRVGELTEAATLFAEKVGKTQQVAVYAFDGAKELHPIAGFQPGGGGLRGSIAALAGYKPRDPSTNLNGAVIEGLKVLQQAMDRATQPIRFGTLVVFTDGTDHAHRVTREKVMESLDQAGDTLNVFTVGVGAEIDPGELRAIGRTQAIVDKDPTHIRKAFDELGQIVEDFAKCFYLLSYCSPARAGEHDVTISAHPGGVKGSGSLSYHFNANGFQPNCDPNTPPSFDVHKPRMNPKK